MSLALTGQRYEGWRRAPDAEGWAERDGVRLAWASYGSGAVTLLLMPTWSILDSRMWKAQVPYLARHYRVLTFDGRGSGASDRPGTPADYTDEQSRPTPWRCWTQRGSTTPSWSASPAG